MNYTIKAHPTEYKGVTFRSRLEARWAAFFDLFGWGWEYEPIDMEFWSPDFAITPNLVKVSNGEKQTEVRLLAEVKPYIDEKDFYSHPCLDYWEGFRLGGKFIAHGVALLGSNPRVMTFLYVYNKEVSRADFVSMGADSLIPAWNKAGAITQYKPRDTEADWADVIARVRRKRQST